MTPRTRAGTLKNCTIPAFTFYGGPGRARIVVYDRQDGSRGFSVTTLRAHYHPSTAFHSHAGVCRYNGPDAAEALRVAQEYSGVVAVPVEFVRYLEVRCQAVR